MKTKKYFLMIAVFCSMVFEGWGQIVFEDTLGLSTYLTTNSGLVRLRYAGDKYFSVYGDSSLQLYNLNHTFYKNIIIPNSNIYGITNSLGVYYISEALFDTDSSTIEYFLYMQEKDSSNNFYFHSHVYDEFGNTLFFKDSSYFNFSSSANEFGFTSQLVFNTDTGTKMMLRKSINTTLVGPHLIYNLPGTLYKPCDCYTESGVPLSAQEISAGADCFVKNYPNPARDKTIIEYKLPKGVHQASLNILSLYGKELKKYVITDRYTTIELDNSELPSGNYFYQLVLPDGKSIAKKMMVIH